MSKNNTKEFDYFYFKRMSVAAIQKWIEDNTKLLENGTDNAALEGGMEWAKLVLEEKNHDSTETEETEQKKTKKEIIEDRKKQNEGYELTEEGTIKSTINNVITYFDNTKEYQGNLRFNEFSEKIEFNGKPIEDMMFSHIVADVENNIHINSDKIIDHALKNVVKNNRYHPIKEKIEKIPWDMTERAETFFIDYIGVEDTPLNRSMTKKWFYAMMKRLYEPACPFDSMLIVYDQTQGTGKTKIIQRLFDSVGLGYTYCTSPVNMRDPVELATILNGCWVIGIDELDGFLKRTPEEAKQILSQEKDTVRPKYARFEKVFLRHCVFYGNTNIDYFLKDYSGGFERRYWVMNAHGTPHNAEWWDKHLPYDICEQILAEIYYHYKNNPKFQYETLSVEEEKELKKVQRGHKTYNNDVVLNSKILKAMNKVYRTNWFRDEEDFCFQAASNEIYTCNDNCGNVITCFDDLQKAHDNMELFSPADQAKEKSTLKEHILDRIPVSYLVAYASQVAKRTISPQYLEAILEDEWKAKVAGYKADGKNTKSVRCFCRK